MELGAAQGVGVTAFYYDIVCPYAYMAFTRLARQNIFRNQGIELRPILLGGLFKLMDQAPDPNKLMSAHRAAYIRQDIVRQAALWSVPLKFHPRHPLSSLRAMRLLIACAADRREELTARLYNAYWQEGRDIDDEGCIAQLGREFGVIPNDSAKEALINATAEAFQERVFGVPTISINGRLYFGSDRLELIQEELGLEMPHLGWTKSEHVVDFYFDFSSPYSYLANVEIEQALRAGVKVNFKPILLGALFKNIGMADIPMLKAHPHKASYYLQDMKDWARARKAPFKFSTHFPLRSVAALRVAIIEPKTIGAMFAAAWADDVDIGQEENVRRVLDQAGFDGIKLLAQTQSPEIKEQLKTNTASAQTLGVFGVPSFMLNGHLVFGQDRFMWLKSQLVAKKEIPQ